MRLWRDHRAGSAWAAGILVAALLSGCGAQQPSSTPSAEPALGPVTAITSDKQVSRPIDTYLPDAQKMLALISVETRKVNDCLASKSITETYAPSAKPAELAPFVAGLVASNVKRSDLWGFFDTDVETTSRYGYTRPPEVPGVLFAAVPAQDEVFQECEAKAYEGLPSNQPVMSLSSASSLPNRGPVVPTTDSRWTAAVAAWAQCMKDAGFGDYPSPQDALGDSKWRGKTSDTVSPEQISTASADISCKLSTNLVGIGLAVQSAYDQAYIDDNREALDTYRKQIDSYLAK